MKKIHDIKFTIYIFDKKEAGLDTEGFLTKKDVSKPADFYVVFKERKTKEIIGKARIDIDDEARKKFNQKKIFDNFKTSKITLYNFKKDLTEKQKNQYLGNIVAWCFNRTTDCIYLNIDNAPEFKSTTEYLEFIKSETSAEYYTSVKESSKMIWLALLMVIFSGILETLFLINILRLTKPAEIILVQVTGRSCDFFTFWHKNAQRKDGFYALILQHHKGQFFFFAYFLS